MPRRTDRCAGCQREFAIGETFEAQLFEGPAGYERRDYCQNCPRPTDVPVVASWKTRRPEPASRKVQPFDREAIYAFFERLEGAAEPQQIQFRFVLALLLWRKRVLRHENTLIENDQEIWEFTLPRTGAGHRVIRPDLDEAELERLSTQVESLLAQQPGDIEAVAENGKEEPRD